jgi:hypothetical protein
MVKITLDAGLASKLQELSRTVELCDPSGKVVGKFVPLVDLSVWEPLTPEITEEELDRLEKSNEKRYSTAEVLAYLKSLEKQ